MMNEGKQYANEVEELQHGDGRFPWGRIIGWHKLGIYDVAEYHPYSETVTGDLFLDRERVEFHGWIDGRDSGRGWTKLEQAIVGLIAIKYDGSNTQAGKFFFRMVRINEVQP